MSSRQDEARAIHDDLLERTRAGYLAGDYTLFENCFGLPHILDTFEGRRVIRSSAEHRRLFDAMRATFRDMGVIDMKRRTIEAMFLTDTKIDATFITEYILAGYKVSEEVIGNATIIAENGVWKVVQSGYATKLNMVSRALLKS